ncbi:MAG: hypothetical protein ACRCWO_08300 [Bosea sp. (in: a-proteobacteria)]
MAKQKKQADPTEAALSAIEEALQLTSAPETPPDDAGKKLPRIDQDSFGASSGPDADIASLNPPKARTKSFQQDKSLPQDLVADDARAQDVPAALAPDTSRVANDDRRDSTALVHAFAARPSRKAYVVAFLASVLWGAVAYFMLQSRVGGTSEGMSSALSAFGVAEWSLAALILAGPIMFFFVLANLFVRSQEMRLISRAMSNVALRLVEPETAAANSVVSLSQAIRREVAAMGDGVERAIARAGELETVVRNEISSLERAYADNDGRLRNLIQELVTQREEIASSSERVRTAITGAHEAVTRDLDSAGRTLSETITGAGDRVVQSLGDRSGEITNSLSQAGDRMVDQINLRGSDLVERLQITTTEVSEKLAAASTGVTSALDDKACDIIQRLETTGGSLASNLNTGGRELISLLETTGTTLTENLNNGGREVITLLERTGAVLTEGLGNGAREVTRTISETGREVAQTIAARAMEVNDTLKTTGETLAGEISSRGEEVVQRFELNGRQLSDTVGRQGSELATLLSTQNAELNKVINTDGRALADEIASHAENVHTKLIEAGDLSRTAVETAGRNLATTLLDQTAVMRTALTDQVDASRQIMTTTARDVVGLLATQSARINEALTGSTETLLVRIDERRGEFENRFTASMGALETLFDRQSSQIETGLESRTTGLDRMFANRATELQAGLEARTAGFEQMFATHATQLEANLTARFGSFEKLMLSDGGALVDRLSADAERLTRTVEDQLARTEKVIVVDGTNLISQIDGRTREITDTMSQRAQEASAILAASSAEAASAMESHIKVFEERSMAKSAEIAGSLDGLIARIDANLGTRASALNDALVERTIDIARVLAEGGRDVTQALSAKADEIGMIVSSKSETLTKTLSDKAEEINSTLGGRALEIADTLDQRVARFEERVVNRLDTVSSTLDERGREIADTLSEQMESVSSLLGSRGDALKQLFTNEGQNMVSALTATNDLLKDEMGGMLARLSQANQLMQQIVASANTNLGAIETGLTKSVADLANVLHGLSEETSQATSKVAQQVETIKQVASQTFAGAENLSDKLESHGRLLAESSISALETLGKTVGDLDMVERRLGDSLAHRAEQLNAAIEHVTQRSEEIENVTRSFASLIEDSLATAQSRAREIGGVLAESAEATSNAIAGQFDSIKQSTGKERERIAYTLRTAYESVQQEVGGGLTQATEQFQQAASELRSMSATIQQELAATRAELKRGVLELPRETQEATSAMRRVVAEQIKALNDLSEIVAGSGRALDVSEGSASRASESRAPESRGLRLPEPRRQEPRAPEPRRSEAVQAEPERARPLPEPPRTAPARAIKPEPAPAGRGGWLSDLLSRASREDEDDERPVAAKPARGPASRIEKLDSISLDIARMIDHDAAVELWDRYQRGERNVFTRRLYTLQGQQAFDEIRRKYRREAEFKDTVDRYVDEFEKLLADVAKDDRDGIVTNTYLTSETGKVYTMLAHASGRFE